MRPLLAFAAIGVLVAGAAAPSSQQAAPIAQTRLLVQDTYLTAIDRGLRADAVRDDVEQRLRARVADRDADVPFERGRVIVKFRSGASPSEVAAAGRSVAATRIERPSWANFDVMTIDPDVDPEEAARALRADPDVEYAQPAYKATGGFRPNDPLYEMQWNLPAIGMERAWDIQQGATSSIVVAVLDTGVAYREAVLRYNAPAWTASNGQRFPALGPVDVPFAAAPDLAGPNRFVAPFDFIWNDALPVDLDGHGTHVSGTVGQLTNNGVGVAGVAFNVRIMPVKVLSDSLWDAIFGSPNRATSDVIARGIRYAADNGANVINMSIVGGGGPVIQDAVRYAVSKDVFVAVCGGNNGETGNAPNRFADFLGSVDGGVAVSAVGSDLQRAPYSTRAGYIELAAPGGNARLGGARGAILQQTIDVTRVDTFIFGPYRAPTVDTFVYSYFQGCSMATPHVAGFAALLMQQGIRRPAAVEAAMKQFARDIGTPGRDDEYGYGVIDPRATLRGLGIAK